MKFFLAVALVTASEPGFLARDPKEPLTSRGIQEGKGTIDESKQHRCNTES